MATLIKTIEELKQYVSVNKSLKWQSVEPYIKQAERKYIKPLTGAILYDDYATTAPTGVEAEVYQLLREASANLAWFLYVPLATLQVSDHGISVAEGEHYKSANWHQIRDLRRSFIDAGFYALDEALKIMEANEVTFDPWADTEGYTIIKELFVTRTETFNRWYNINNSRKTFLALRPYMLETHHQYFTSQLNTNTRNTIATGTKAVHKQVLNLMQAAMVNYAVVKAVDSGAFDLSIEGLQPKLSELPNSKNNTYDEVQISRIKSERLTAAEQYYKKAIALITDNSTDFPDFTAKAVANFVKPKNTKSTVSF